MIDDFAARELCHDGACIGVIGPDGLCKECGKPSPTLTQNPRNRGMVTPEEGEADLPEDDAFAGEDRKLCPDGACVGVIGPDGTCTECGRAPAEAQDEAVHGAPPGGGDEFDSRQLCPDGGCIGLIGDDGRCRECGRQAGAAAPAEPDSGAAEEE
jgi:hypothetical protein